MAIRLNPTRPVPFHWVVRNNFPATLWLPNEATGPSEPGRTIAGRGAVAGASRGDAWAGRSVIPTREGSAKGMASPNARSRARHTTVAGPVGERRDTVPDPRTQSY